jgi:hypothetical protein
VNAVAALREAIRRSAARLGQLGDVEVQLQDSSFAAVPLNERQRAAGVARGDVLYSEGEMCVVENQPQYSFTLVGAVAAQVLTRNRMRLHAVFRAERCLRSGNEHEEIWRGRREVPAEEHEATNSAVALGAELEHQLESVVSTYEALRRSGPASAGN